MPSLSWSDAIRYLLVGIVAFLCYAYVDPVAATKLAYGTGKILLTGAALAFGSLFFYVYDALVLPLIHIFKDVIGNSDVTYRVRLRKKFPDFSLSCSDAEFVYVALLRGKVGWKEVPGLDILTSGIHLLYMSALLACFFGAYALCCGLTLKRQGGRTKLSTQYS